MKKYKFCFLTIITAALANGCTEGSPTLESKALHPTEKSVVSSAPSYDGPFGLKMGLSRDQLKSIIPSAQETQKERFIWTSNSVPIPHPNFDSYLFGFSEKSGLCSIVAIGKEIKSSNTGDDIKVKFSAIDEALSKKYGKGVGFDFVSNQHSSPEFWMLELFQKNRTLAKSWHKDEGSKLPEELLGIEIQAHADNISSGYISIRYEFINITDCSNESELRNNKGL